MRRSQFGNRHSGIGLDLGETRMIAYFAIYHQEKMNVAEIVPK